MDLSTRYLGLELANPLVASASSLSNARPGKHRAQGYSAHRPAGPGSPVTRGLGPAEPAAGAGTGPAAGTAR